jgi:hypothetical protein
MTTPTVDLTPAALNVKLYRGDDSIVKVTLQDDDGPVVLPTTGWSAQLRTSRDATEVAATITVDPAQAATGILFLTFPDTTTLPSGLYYDVQCSTGGLRTWLRGRVSLSGDVTRA